MIATPGPGVVPHAEVERVPERVRPGREQHDVVDDQLADVQHRHRHERADEPERGVRRDEAGARSPDEPEEGREVRERAEPLAEREVVVRAPPGAALGLAGGAAVAPGAVGGEGHGGSTRARAGGSWGAAPAGGGAPPVGRGGACACEGGWLRPPPSRGQALLRGTAKRVGVFRGAGGRGHPPSAPPTPPSREEERRRRNSSYVVPHPSRVVRLHQAAARRAA